MYLQLIYYVLILQLYFNRKTYIYVTNFSILISMITKRHLLFICFLIVCIIKGQAQDITFGHLTTNEGLSNNAVMTMYQDERGFIWIGTRNGANLYNGNEFKVYKFRKNSSNSLIYNNINHITGNKKGEVYFMTPKGISALNIRKDTFTTLIQKEIRAMFYHEQLYAAHSNSIYIYDGKQFSLYYELPQKSKITALHVNDNQILIGTENQGLFSLDRHHQLSHPISKGNISTIFQDSSGKYWIGSWEEGLFMMNGETISNFRHEEKNPSSISSNFIRCCSEDKQGNLWIGTFNGLNMFHPSSQTFTRYQKRENGLSHSSVWSILCDHQGSIWVGTYFGGVNYFNPESQIYHQYQAAKTESEGLSSPIVGRITEDSQHNLWIGTEGGGLNKYDPKSRKFEWFRHSKLPGSLSHNNVKALYYDPLREVIWIGTHLGGLNKMDLKTKKFTQYFHNENDPESLPSNIIRDIIPYKEQLIIASHAGVCIFNPETGKVKRLFQTLPYKITYAAGIFIDHRGTLWICGGGNGVYSYQFDNQKITNYKHNHALEHGLSSNRINRIYEDSQHRLWLCSNESGIDLYRYDTDDFINFDREKNELASDCVNDVCELSPGKLLFTTDVGFSILDYQTQRFKNYDHENGVPLSAINERSLYKSQQGEIFIGGIDGMISFKEKDINYIPKGYTIAPFRLIVNGQDVNVDDDSGILKEDLSITRKLVLKSSQSMFSIEYAISNYIPAAKNEMEYFLEGFSETWTTTRGQNTITYTNLSPGKYTLLVRIKNNQSQIPESRLDIVILPPFYLTIWAYLFYFIIIASVLYYLIRTYNNRIKLQESLKYEKKRTEDIERLNQAKLRFFTNISHEFRTPLTLIIGQMEMLLQVRSFAPTVYNKILGAYKNSLQLRELITELLDFRKQEQGYMTIKVSEHNIVDFLYENYLLFQEYALQRQISFNFRKTNDSINVWYDAKQLQKVMNNLISNAFKHTKEGGEISVSVRKGNREVIIEVTDNGTGIAAEDINKIFNRFYQTDQIESLSYTGTGIGLSLTKGIVELHHGTIDVYSEPGEETTFSVHLKTGNEHFTPEQFSKRQEESQLALENNIPLQELQEQLLNEQEVMSNENIEKSKEARILIVEDNDSLREMLVKIFESFYVVSTAANGREGWEKIQSEQPAIVLSDVVMPEMSGTELCKLIKENIETCHIPVVLLTARTAIEHNLEGLRLGADDYITKPFNINILLSRCNNLVNNRIILQEKFSKQPQATPQILATNAMDKELVDRAMKVIESHIDNVEFNVDILARETGIARTKLFTKLKAITGQTPYEFILTIRLKRAAIMLKENPELNISEISDRLGFSSPRQFSKCFKEKYRVVPQTYRKGENADNEEEEE